MKKKSNIREWDFGKEGVTSTVTQEEWVDRQRRQRDSEFAPPSTYTHNNRWKSDQGGQQQKAAYGVSQEYESAGNSHNLKSRTFFSHDTSSVQENIKGSTNDSYREALREERSHEFAPPSTYEYYGPTTSRGRTRGNKPQYSAMEEAINKGLSHLRKMSS